jgi:hypothetical protein
MSSGRVLAVDACRRGWIAIAVEDAVTGAYFAEDIQELVARAESGGPSAPRSMTSTPASWPARGSRHSSPALTGAPQGSPALITECDVEPDRHAALLVEYSLPASPARSASCER